MCFSAPGSFAISGVLAGIGTASLVGNASKPHRMFAAIPLLFATQQAAEGVVWLTVGNAAHASLNQAAVIAFLAVAVVVWPVWLPGSLLRAERHPARRRVLTWLFWIGVAMSTSAVVLLILWSPGARVTGHSLAYDYPTRRDTQSHLYILAVYVLPTIAPFFVSSARFIKAMGLVLVASLVLTFYVQRDALTSVWCFFASILSAFTYVIVRKEQGPATGGDT